MKQSAPGIGKKAEKSKHLLIGGGRKRRRKPQNGRKRNKCKTKRRPKLPRKFRRK